MNIQDPIADMLTRIRNSQVAKKNIVSIPLSKIKKEIAVILKKEGFIKNFEVNKIFKPELILNLKYFREKPVIEIIKRISSPGLRIYKNKKKLPKVMSGMGIAIISTSKGLMTDKIARKNNIGGEIICYIA